MKRVATSVIEVRDGRVKNYGRDYDAYLYAVKNEIEEGERQRSGSNSASQSSDDKGTKKTKNAVG